jgi:hypothetical protein
MNRLVPALIATTLLASCGTPLEASESAGPSPTTTTTVAEAFETAGAMAAALLHLVVVDNTFGQGSSPFVEYVIGSRTDPRAGAVSAPSGADSRTLTDAERRAIEDALSDLGPVSWVDDLDQAMVETADLKAVLGVGEPLLEGDTGLVPVSMWCGSMCGTWLTYRVERINGVWTVTGIEGPIAVS